MNNDLSLKIVDFYVEIDKIHDEIKNKFFNFITKAKELVELSEDDYQIEKTLKLNKISLKAFILDSSCCVALNDNNITNYSIKDLNGYLMQYEQSTNEDYSKYYLAVSLYENVEDIEKLVDKKISLETKELSQIVSDINNIKGADKNKYETLYFDIKNRLDEFLKNNRLDEKSYDICIQILNDIFNFYISGYPIIPDEYLYKEDSSL